MSDSLWSPGLQPARLPGQWGFPAKNIGVGCHFLLQWIFLTQGSNPCLLHLLHWQVDSLPLSHQGSPNKVHSLFIFPQLLSNVLFLLENPTGIPHLLHLVITSPQTLLSCDSFSDFPYFCFFFKYFIGVSLIFNVVLVSAVQQSESVLHIHISLFLRFFTHLGHYRVLSRVPYATQQVLLIIYFPCFKDLNSFKACCLGVL